MKNQIEITKENSRSVYVYEQGDMMFMAWAKCVLPEKGVRQVVRAIENHVPEIVIGEYHISGLA